MPLPVAAEIRPGSLDLRRGLTTIGVRCGDARVARALVRFGRQLTQMRPRVPGVRGGRAAFTVSCNRRVGSIQLPVEDESYSITVRPLELSLSAQTPYGVLRGLETILQLVERTDTSLSIPALTIEDRPRYPWRGLMIDVSRHWMPKEVILRNLDAMAAVKLNVLHLHLSDDQAFRVESRLFPRLHTEGSGGNYYTQDDVREIVAYAAERFVTIVPEIEMPGHSQAAIASYPYLGNFGDTIRPWTMWGVTNYILNPSDTTIAFMQDVLTEVMQLFPGKMIHIGGDEAPKLQWRASPRAQSLIDRLGIRDTGDSPTRYRSEDRLQSWFTTKMDSFLTAHGRRLVGWDEILEGGLAPNAVVMSWRGVAGGVAAAREGHDVIMTPGQYTYLDHYQASPDSEPLAIGGFLPLDSVYLYDPVPAELEPSFAKHVIGAQGQVWTEYIEGPKQVEYMAYPRAAALAEVLWSPVNRRDLSDFKRRLVEHERRLGMLDVNFRR